MPVSPVSPIRLTFRKRERLRSKKIIRELALKGKNIHLSPLRVVWLPVGHDESTSVQAAFTVPKRIFKNATDRNRIKRRLKEAYRKNKSEFYPLIAMHKTQFALLFIYTGKESVSFAEAEEKIKILLIRLAEDIKKNNS